MSHSNSVEKEVNKDNYYVNTVNSEAPSPQIQNAQPYQRTFGNPAPLGMLAYGTVFLCSSILTLTGAGVDDTYNLVMVFATFYGGISQTIVGLWEMFLGNTFSATVFGTYGGFNFSYGALYLPQLGLTAAYTVDGQLTQAYYNALGIYMAIWCLITFVFLLGALRTTLPIVGTLGFTVFALACLSANAFTGIDHLATAGGALGICASFGAYYGALSLFWTQQTTYSWVRLNPVILAPV